MILNHLNLLLANNNKHSKQMKVLKWKFLRCLLQTSCNCAVTINVSFQIFHPFLAMNNLPWDLSQSETEILLMNNNVYFKWNIGVVTSAIINFCSSPFVVSKGRRSGPSSRFQTIQFTLNEEQGYYEIGPQQDGNQIFVLSVTIGLASNLAKVQYIWYHVFLFISSL